MQLLSVELCFIPLGFSSNLNNKILSPTARCPDIGTFHVGSLGHKSARFLKYSFISFKPFIEKWSTPVPQLLFNLNSHQIQ